MSKRVKLSDIATELGVSIVTVSNALTGKKGVSEELRKQIEEKANEMGYIKNQPSQSSQNTTKGYNLGVLVSERYLGRSTSFYWELYQKFANIASQKGSFTMLEVLSLQNEMATEMPGLLQESKIDGMVIIGRLEKAYIKKISEVIDVPLVFVDFYEEDVLCDSVISDSYYGMYKMTKYLIHEGHREIAFVGNVLATSSITDRYMGFCKALLEHGIEVRKEWVIPDRNLEDGKMHMELPDTMPTSFVCNCDLAAEMLIEKLTTAGYKIPEDISVVGYDNFSYSAYISKNLTTYDVDTYRLAKESHHILMKKIKKTSTYKGIHTIQGNMLIRNSVRSINPAE